MVLGSSEAGAVGQEPGLQGLQQRLGYGFHRPEVLRQALTHRSYGLDHNERLEFLGDSVLGLCVADLLYERLKALPEGDLSRVRANLVRQETLHQLALNLDLPALVRLGEGEMRSGGQQRASILADALEALLGAVYLDGGFVAARSVVHQLYRSVDINPAMPAMGKDGETALQEWLQARRMKLPDYSVLAITGAAHAQTFEVRCDIAALQQSACGSGVTRRAAEQSAAQAMLLQLQAYPPKKRTKTP